MKELRADLMSGTVVGVVAIPLSMALSIAVGVPPQHGLYTAVIAGALVALLGGSKHQITGPTAAFVVILAPIVSKHGLSGLLTAGFMAGLVLVAMGAMRLGRLLQYIPHPVTTGFTSGIAVVIATLQLKDVFGLRVENMPDEYAGKLEALWHARNSASLAEVGVAAATLAFLLLVPRLTKKIPAPLIALTVMAIAATALHRAFPSFSVATIGSRFHPVVRGITYDGVPPVLPTPQVPWAGHFSLELVHDLAPAAFAIAMLGAIESLLSAVIADGMTGKKHDPDAELVGLGIGNLVVPFFGGIAATGALARTATNIRSGAKSPFSAVVHAIVVLLSIVLLSKLVAYVPMAALAALLLVVAWNMSEARHFVHLLRVATKSDAALLLTCFGLTVWFDMVIAISVGVVLAALLFMRRMAEMTEGRAVMHEGTNETERDVPPGVLLYEINGPLFFGAAKSAMGELEVVASHDLRVVVIDLHEVPVIDVTGLVALESAIDALRRSKGKVVLAGPFPAPEAIWTKAGLDKQEGVYVANSLPAALDRAARLASEPAPPSQRASVPAPAR